MSGNDTKAEVNDLVHIGSCTKAMTGLLIADLVTRGSLKFDTKLGEIFDNEPLVTDSTWADVTVTELLQHRSGAPANAAWHELDAENPGDVVKADVQCCSSWSHRSVQATKFLYSNLGYSLLGHIIENHRRQKLGGGCHRAFVPAAEDASASFGPIGKAVDPKSVTSPEFAFGHVEDVQVAGVVAALLGGQKKVKQKAVQIDKSPSLGPAGRVHIAIDDGRISVALRPQRGTKELNIRDDVWKTLLKPEFGGNYAGGWLLENRDWAGGPTRWHNGSNTTWYCIAYALPEKGIGVIAVTNTYIEGSRDACEKAAELASRLELHRASQKSDSTYGRTFVCEAL